MKPHHFDCTLVWTGASAGTTSSYGSYSRDLRITAPGKPDLAMSAAAPFRGDPAKHDPEVLLVASLSACHCLSYLALAARAGLHVLSYEDHAEGRLEHDGHTFRFVEVTLHPRVTLAAGADLEKALTLHDRAHEECFIARSVNFPVRHDASVA